MNQVTENSTHSTKPFPASNGSGASKSPATKKSERKNRSHPGWIRRAIAEFLHRHFPDAPPIDAAEHGQLARIEAELKGRFRERKLLLKRYKIAARELCDAEETKYSEDRPVQKRLCSANGLLLVSVGTLCGANGTSLILEHQVNMSLLSAFLAVAPLALAGLALDLIIHGPLKPLERPLMACLLAGFLVSLGTFGWSVADRARDRPLTSASLREGDSQTLRFLSQQALEISMATIFFGAARRQFSLRPSQRFSRREEDARHLLERLAAVQEATGGLIATRRQLRHRIKQSRKLRRSYRHENH